MKNTVSHEGDKKQRSERWLFALLLLPVSTQLIETGQWPHGGREFATDIGLTLCIGILVVALRRRHAKLIFLSETDPLTGLANRRKFDIDLHREVARAHRMSAPLVLAFLDVDHFKRINDTFGHVQGDRVLVQIARQLRASVRSDVDSCYRIGGDEFAVLLPGSQSGGTDWIDSKLEYLTAHACDTVNDCGAEISIGAALLKEGENAERFLQRADRLMYQKKSLRKIQETGI